MTDTENHNLKDPEKEAEQKLSQAQASFQTAFMTFIEAVMDYGWEAGWSKGYDAGWDAAFEYLKSQESTMRIAAREQRPRAPAAPQPSLPLLQVGSQLRMTAVEMVLEHIQNSPGQRGIDIASYFARHSPPIPERTIRTALHRLKTFSGKIKNVNGRWYPSEGVPIQR